MYHQFSAWKDLLKVVWGLVWLSKLMKSLYFSLLEICALLRLPAMGQEATNPMAST